MAARHPGCERKNTNVSVGCVQLLIQRFSCVSELFERVIGGGRLARSRLPVETAFGNTTITPALIIIIIDSRVHTVFFF
jgi:hypothetical protein